MSKQTNILKLASQIQETTIKGQIFIVPNTATCVADYDNGKGIIMPWTWSSFKEKENRNEKFVQISGVFFDKNGNEHDMNHDYEELKDFSINHANPGYFAGSLPESWLKDKKDGDIIFIDICDELGEKVLAQVELKLAQDSGGYGRYGRFEEVFAKVTA